MVHPVYTEGQISSCNVEAFVRRADYGNIHKGTSQEVILKPLRREQSVILYRRADQEM
jgi:hypothetical protein